MNIAVKSRSIEPPFSQREIDADAFAIMRQENLARWPTGALVDFDAAVSRHKSLPRHKNLAHAFREAEVSGRCLTQPRGGFGTLADAHVNVDTLVVIAAPSACGYHRLRVQADGRASQTTLIVRAMPRDPRWIDSTAPLVKSDAESPPAMRIRLAI